MSFAPLSPKENGAASPRTASLSPDTERPTASSAPRLQAPTFTGGITMLDEHKRPRLSSDGRPLPILRTNREFGYGRFRRLNAEIKVRFCFDRNEMLYFEKEVGVFELVEPPPTLDLAKAVKTFLTTSRKNVLASRRVRDDATEKAEEAQAVTEELQTATEDLQQEIAQEDKKIEGAMQELRQKTQERAEKFREAKERKRMVVMLDDDAAPKSRLCCFR